jgi:hypothetical protein
MCTYQTTIVDVDGSAKARTGWFSVKQASIYLDHPVHAPYAHTLNIDVADPSQGASARVALELEPGSARAFAEAVLAAIDACPPALLESRS